MKKQIGVAAVDSGQLMICDPCYIENEWNQDGGDIGETHTIYRHTGDNKLWQFCYGNRPTLPEVNKFPGNYQDVIAQYDKNPNELIESGEFVDSGLDAMAHIPTGEFSYRGACKATLSKEIAGQLIFKLGHEGAGVVFTTGYGDGLYPVFAEFNKDGRIKSVTVKFF